MLKELCVASQKAKASCILWQKRDILDRVKSETVSNLAGEYSIGNSTITDLA